MVNSNIRFSILPPEGRRKSWHVHAIDSRGRCQGIWSCDTEAVAGLVAKRLRSGRHPGWAAHDLRHGITR